MRQFLVLLCLASLTAFAQTDAAAKDRYYTGVLQKVRSEAGVPVFAAAIEMTFMIHKADGTLVTDDPVDAAPVKLKKTKSGWKGKLPNGVELVGQATHTAHMLVVDVQAVRGGRGLGGIRFYLAPVTEKKYKELRNRAVTVNKARKLMAMVLEAIQAYDNDEASFPASGNANLVKHLDGDASNGGPKKKYFDFGTAKLNAKGELLDPWGNALHYEMKGGKITMRSNGPNGKDETGKGDDVVLLYPPRR